MSRFYPSHPDCQILGTALIVWVIMYVCMNVLIRLIKRISEKFSKRISAKFSKRISTKFSKQISAKLSKQISAKNVKQIAANCSNECPQNFPNGFSTFLGGPEGPYCSAQRAPPLQPKAAALRRS